MPSCLRNDIVLVQFPFSDQKGTKVRPAIVVSAPHRSHDLFIVPLTSRTDRPLEGEFLLADWRASGLNMPTLVKRGLFTIHETFVLKRVGAVSSRDSANLERSLKQWLSL